MSEGVAQRPASDEDRGGWKAHWMAQGMPWRTEPEIDAERQQYLAERRAIVPDILKGMYPFKDENLTRADVERLLATHESDGIRGPVDLSDEKQHERKGLDLRGAILRDVNLNELPLAGLIGGLTLDDINRNPLGTAVNPTVYQAATERAIEMAAIHLELASLWNTDLSRASLLGAHLECAVMYGTCLERSDLLWAHLEQARLLGARLERARLGLAHLEGAQLAGAFMEGAALNNVRASHADMLGAYLNGADLNGGHFEEARFPQAQLAGVDLTEARLEGAIFDGAHLEGREMEHVALERVRQWDSSFPASLPAAKLSSAFLNANTSLKGAVLGDEKRGGISLVDAHLDGVNLAAANMEHLNALGEERETQQSTHPNGTAKDEATRLNDYHNAVRANRQFAVALRNQGLNERADRFAYRAQVLQRKVLWRQIFLREKGKRVGLSQQIRALASYVGSGLLDLIAGYGYRPGRSIIAYIVIICGFAGLYLLNSQFASPHLRWDEALVLSISSFHGRGFFTSGVSLGDTLARLAAGEAIVGLLLEITFIATFTQRFFAR